jgi:hypothetical protein
MVVMSEEDSSSFLIQHVPSPVFKVYGSKVIYFIEGCGGLWIASLPMTLCFISDITIPGKQRSFDIGVLETSFELGSLLL